MRFASLIPLIRPVGQALLANAKKRDIRSSNTLRLDPTRTTMIRRKFMLAIRKRFKALGEELVDFVKTKDALGLNPRVAFVTMAQPREFEFQTSADKLKTFNSWFAQQVDAKIFAPAVGTPISQPWTTEFVESAYRRGQLNAWLSVRGMDLPLGDDNIGELSSEEFLRSSFAAPETMSKVQLLATRTYEQLKGVTSAMASEMNWVMATAIADGLGAEETARRLMESLGSLTRSRAMTLARTELIYTHAEGQLDAFSRLGITKLGLKAEWATAGDDHVCPLCQARSGSVYTIDSARGLIPLHPNCRCTWIPVPPEI